MRDRRARTFCFFLILALPPLIAAATPASNTGPAVRGSLIAQLCVVELLVVAGLSHALRQRRRLRSARFGLHSVATRHPRPAPVSVPASVSVSSPEPRPAFAAPAHG